MTQKKSILIIEDDQLFAEKLKYLLEGLTDKITVVSTVARGTYFLPKLKPDVVFLDNKLPRIEGLEAVAFFKELSPKTKLVLMSGVFNNQEKMNAIESGADYVIDKTELTKTSAVNIALFADETFSAKNISLRINNQ